MRWLVTGGAGFIGSAFVRTSLATHVDLEVLNVDKLTYAGNLENLEPVAGDPRYQFLQADIADRDSIEAAIASFRPDAIIHLAAESHVDRSIHNPEPVFETNLRGTFCLLEAARRYSVPRFLHVSTDEVYGSVPAPLVADETFPLRTSSPYSASKGGSDLLALSYHTTYGMAVTVTRASNNYGPYQFPEKLIPLMIANALEDRPLPVYGDGQQVRDWLYVEDHCAALRAVLERGRAGEVYNIGGNCSLPNLEVVRRILAATGKSEALIRFVADRPGHDRRYALDSNKIQREIGWRPATDFDSGLAATVAWYRNHPGWVARVRSGEYQRYYQQNYGPRLGQPRVPARAG